MAQILPLSNSPDQSIRTALTVNGKSLTLNLRVYFNAAGGFWVMDVADQNGNRLVSSVPLLTGIWPAANVLAHVDYLGIGSAFIINQAGSPSSGDWPNEKNLGAGYCLLWDDN